MTARQQKETETRVDASEVRGKDQRAQLARQRREAILTRMAMQFIKRLEDLFERTKDARSVHICAKQGMRRKKKKKRSLSHMILSHTHQQRDIIIITITIVVVDTSYDIPRV